MWLFLLLSSWILFSQGRASFFGWGHGLRKTEEILLVAANLWHCPVAAPGCHNDLSYPEQGSMNLTCLSASVALFHRQNVGQGLQRALKTPGYTIAHRALLKLPNGREKRESKMRLWLKHLSGEGWAASSLFWRHIWACLPQPSICTLPYLKWEMEHRLQVQSFI